MSACQGSADAGALVDTGGAISRRRVEPHFVIAQSGASRSVSPESERMACRFLEAR